MTDLIGAGSAAGGQAQTNQILQLLAQIVQALQGNSTGSAFQVYPWTSAGNVDIAANFANAKAGIIAIKQTVPAALNVTLNTAGGPWTVGDAAGVAAADNITVLPPGGYTIKGSANDVISTNWQFRTYVLDGTNFIVTSSS